MKQLLHICLIICLAASHGACKAIGEKFVAAITMPIFNPEVISLVHGLTAYKITNQAWPGSLEELQSDLMSDSLALHLDHYNTLNWTMAGDTLKVNFDLQYTDTYTSKFRFMHGNFVLFLEPDSTIYLLFHDVNGESKDGSVRWGESKQEPDKRPRKPNAIHFFPSTSEK